MTSGYMRANWGPISVNDDGTSTRLAIPVDATIKLVRYNAEQQTAFIEVNSRHEYATGWIGGKFAEGLAQRLELQAVQPMGALIDPNASGVERVLAVGIGSSCWTIFAEEADAIRVYGTKASHSAK